MMDHIYVTDDITNILLGKDSPGTENKIFDPFSAGCMIMEEKRHSISQQLAASGTKFDKTRRKSIHWNDEDENQKEKPSSFDSPPVQSELDVSIIKERIGRRRLSEATSLKSSTMLSKAYFAVPPVAPSKRTMSLPCGPTCSAVLPISHGESTQNSAVRDKSGKHWGDTDQRGVTPHSTDIKLLRKKFENIP